MWVPLLGDRFAHRLARVAVVRQLRLPLIIVFLAGTAPFQLTRDTGAAVLAIVAGGVLVVGAVALTVAYRRMLRVIETDLQRDLESAGLPMRTPPSLRSPDALEWWCDDNEITRRDLSTALGLMA